MGDFSAEWLRLREPVDHAARSASLTRDLLRALPARPLRILDLACGTGSNLRYLQGQIAMVDAESPQRQKSDADPDWLLTDHDPSLLALVPASPNVKTLEHDLRSLGDGLFTERSLVTASALLDLVSDSWMRRLASQCRTQGAAALFALTYDGRVVFEPADPDDALVRDLVNRHQRTDKGFGPALGPSAPDVAASEFRRVGYVVRIAPSDWVLSHASAPDELQEQLIDGWAEAASVIAPEQAGRVKAWRRKRRDHVTRRRSRLIVGHQDLSAVLSKNARDTRLADGPPAV